MYEWTEPYEDEYIKERIEELRRAQKTAAENGRVLVSTYEQLWLPALNDLPDVEYLGRERHRAPYGTFEPAQDVPFHGALWFTPAKDVELPPSLYLLQKSYEFKIVERSDQVETQSKAFTSVAISLAQNTKNLYPTNNMLNKDTLTG